MRDQGLGSWPRRRARMSPHRVALSHDGVDLTYRELDDAVTRVAHGLRDRGIDRGDRVAYLGFNSIELVVAMFATARLGAVFLPLNTRLAPPETAYILADSEPSLLLWSAGFEGVAESADVAARSVTQLRFDRLDIDGMGGLVGADATPIDEPIGLDDLFMIQYTSGTSGRPKGVRLSHANITWNVYNLLVDVDLRSDEVALVTAPLFHTAALNQVLLPTLLKGGTAVIESSFDPDRAVRLIAERRITLLFGVSSMYAALTRTDAWHTADLTSLRTALSGGAPIPETLLRAWVERGLMIIQGYGLTEASPGATMLRAEDGLSRLGSAGTACFFSDVRIVHPDLTDVEVGDTGEILVQGPNVTSGYWGRPDATSAALTEDGWLRTGDLARADDDGFIHVVDRLKDMIISGGENIYPAEVEAAIYTHPAVAECAVIGVPDERWGEVGRAIVVARDGYTVTSGQIVEHLDGRLARYKIPRSVLFSDTLPHTASGKLIKARVREMHGATDTTIPRTP